MFVSSIHGKSAKVTKKRPTKICNLLEIRQGAQQNRMHFSGALVIVVYLSKLRSCHDLPVDIEVCALSLPLIADGFDRDVRDLQDVAFLGHLHEPSRLVSPPLDIQHA